MAATRVSELYRTAFITGASTGLGRAFTEMLLAEGVRVWGTSRNLARLTAIASAHPGRFTPVTLDLLTGAAAEAIFLEADRDAGGFDILINNAGFGIFAEFTAADFELWRGQLEAMLIQPARLSRAALHGMTARNRGALVNISSLAAEFPLPFQSAYNMSKAALSALSESLMAETAGSDVVVLDVRPGDYRTDFEGSVQRPQANTTVRMQRAWVAFDKMMQSGPPPAEAAAELRRALLRQTSGTVRIGRFFQARLAPFLARFGTLALKRRLQAMYHNAT